MFRSPPGNIMRAISTPALSSLTGLLKSLAPLLLAAILAGCAGSERLKEARAFAADAPKLSGYTELSQRYRDTYQREKPYLSPAADKAEQPIDTKRRDAYPDFIAIHTAVVAYMRALGALAGDKQFDVGDQIKDVATGIKAWPDTGLTDRYVNAYSGLARVLARAVTRPRQEQAVQEMLHDGYAPMRESLEAMSTLLRYYDKNHDNERAIVMGMLETEIPFADKPQERLLAALAKAHQQDKANEYRLLGLRHTLAAKNVQEIRDRYEALYRRFEPAPAASPGARVAAATTQQGAQP